MSGTIRVMPSFDSEQGVPLNKPKKSNSVWWIIALVILLVIGGGVFAFFALVSKPNIPQPNIPKTNTTIQPIPTQDNNSTQESQLDPSNVTLFDLKTPSGRDSQRIFDMKSIAEKLSTYTQSHNGIYPTLLNDLSEDGTALPRDPDSSRGYIYEVNTDGTRYTIQFAIEFGTSDGFRYLTPGEYMMTPDGIISVNAASDETNTGSEGGINIPSTTTGDNPSTTESTTPTNDSTPRRLLDALDTDFDGLTDFEEAIFGTDNRVADTDKDGFIDGVETINLYDPVTPDGNLETSTAITRYSNKTFKYTFLYPRLWELKTLDATDRSVTIDTSTGEKLQILVEDNPNGLSTVDWYLTNSPGATRNDFQEINKGFIKGIKTLNGLNIYFADAKNMFIFTYNPQLQKEFRYPKIFEMLVRSILFN